MSATEPDVPFPPHTNATRCRVTRLNPTSGKYDGCTVYDDGSRTVATMIPIEGDAPLHERILDMWGSGTYRLQWFGLGNKAVGWSVIRELKDPNHPTKPLQHGGPTPITIGGAPPAATAPVTAIAVPPDLAWQIEALERKCERIQLEKDQEVARVRAEEERRRERERDAADLARRRDEEDYNRRCEAERRRHREELEDARSEHRRRIDSLESDHKRKVEDIERRHRDELAAARRDAEASSSGVDRDAFEDAIERVESSLRKQIAEEKKGFLSELAGFLQAAAPTLGPLLAQFMAARGMNLPALPAHPQPQPSFAPPAPPVVRPLHQRPVPPSPPPPREPEHGADEAPAAS